MDEEVKDWTYYIFLAIKLVYFGPLMLVLPDLNLDLASIDNERSQMLEKLIHLMVRTKERTQRYKLPESMFFVFFLNTIFARYAFLCNIFALCTACSHCSRLLVRDFIYTPIQNTRTRLTNWSTELIRVSLAEVRAWLGMAGLV